MRAKECQTLNVKQRRAFLQRARNNAPKAFRGRPGFALSGIYVGTSHRDGVR